MWSQTGQDGGDVKCSLCGRRIPKSNFLVHHGHCAKLHHDQDPRKDENKEISSSDTPDTPPDTQKTQPKGILKRTRKSPEDTAEPADEGITDEAGAVAPIDFAKLRSHLKTPKQEKKFLLYYQPAKVNPPSESDPLYLKFDVGDQVRVHQLEDCSNLSYYKTAIPYFGERGFIWNTKKTSATIIFKDGCHIIFPFCSICTVMNEESSPQTPRQQSLQYQWHDVVQIKPEISPKRFQDMQRSYVGKWSKNMSNALGVRGHVTYVWRNEKKRDFPFVKFANNLSFYVNPGALEKVDTSSDLISLNDYVLITTDKGHAIRQLDSNGGWTDHMKYCLGFRGQVVRIIPPTGYLVSTSEGVFIWTRSCLDLLMKTDVYQQWFPEKKKKSSRPY